MQYVRKSRQRRTFFGVAFGGMNRQWLGGYHASGCKELDGEPDGH